MTTFSLPLNAKLVNSESLPEYTARTSTTGPVGYLPKVGMIPTVYALPFTYNTIPIANSVSTGVFNIGVVPAGHAILDVVYAATSTFSGNGTGVQNQITIGFGDSPTTRSVIYGTSYDNTFIYRANSSIGNVTFGEALTTDTTISLTMSGSAAGNLGSLTQGNAKVFITVGTPFNQYQ